MAKASMAGSAASILRWPTWLATPLVAVLVLSAPPAIGASASRIANAKGVVRLMVVPQNRNGSYGYNTGSGFKVGPGLYVTNRHVVEGALNGDFEVWVVPSTPGSEPIIARVRATSDKDLALVVVSDNSQPVLTLHPKRPGIGDDVWAMGYPGQLDSVMQGERARGAEPAVTRGVIIGHGPKTLKNGVQIVQVVHNADTWPGNSGGPLVDDCGRVVGINTWLHVDAGLAQQNLAVSAADLSDFLAANGVSAAIDARACVDGQLEAGIPGTAAAPTDPGQAPPVTRASSTGGGVAAFVILLALLAAAVGGAIAFIARQQSTERSVRTRFDDNDW